MALHPESAPFRGLAAHVVRHRWAWSALLLLATAAAVASMAQRLRIDSSIEYLIGQDSDVIRVLDEFRADFGRDDLHLVLVEGDVFSPVFLERLRALHTDLEAIDPELGAAPVPEAAEDPFADAFAGFAGDEGWGGEQRSSLVEEVISLVTFRQTVWEDGGIRAGGLLEEPPSTEEIPALRARVLSDPRIVGSVVDAEGRHAVLGVRTRLLDAEDERVVNDAVLAVAAAHDADGFRVQVTGLPDLIQSINETMVRDLGRLSALAFLVLGALLLVLFRHPVGVVGPLLSIVLAAIWTLGVMALLQIPVSVLTNVLPSFLFCVGLGDSVHIQNAYRARRSAGAAHHEAVVSAVGRTGLPVLFTTVTTAVGLLSFWSARTQAIREFGTAGALGVLFALLASIVVLPIVLSFDRSGRLARREDRPGLLDRVVEGCTGLSASPARRRATLILTAVALAVAAVGAARIAVYHNSLTFLQEDHRTRLALEEMDAHVGGTAVVHLLVDAPSQRGATELALLRALERVEARAAAFVHPETGQAIVTQSTSLLDVLRETNRALHGGDPAFYRLPDTQEAVSQNLLLFENADPEALASLVTADLRRTHVTLRLRWLDATSYVPFTGFLEEVIAEEVGELATVRPTGDVHNTVHVMGLLLGDLMRSALLALVAVSAMMLLLLREPRLFLIGLAPAILPIALLLGFMGYAGIPLDVSNMVIASIVIGVAVDDAVHYLHHVKQQRRRGAGVEAAITETLTAAGRAMVATSGMLAAGFLVFTASSLANVQRFGVLVSVTCLVALLVTLVLTPALLRVLFPASVPAAEVVRAVGRPA